MPKRKECSECGSFDTERVHAEWFTGGIEEVRICNDCPAQFTNYYDLFDKSTDEVVEATA